MLPRLRMRMSSTGRKKQHGNDERNFANAEKRSARNGSVTENVREKRRSVRRMRKASVTRTRECSTEMGKIRIRSARQGVTEKVAVETMQAEMFVRTEMFVRMTTTMNVVAVVMMLIAKRTRSAGGGTRGTTVNVEMER